MVGTGPESRASELRAIARAWFVGVALREEESPGAMRSASTTRLIAAGRRDDYEKASLQRLTSTIRGVALPIRTRGVWITGSAIIDGGFLIPTGAGPE